MHLALNVYEQIAILDSLIRAYKADPTLVDYTRIIDITELLANLVLATKE